MNEVKRQNRIYKARHTYWLNIDIMHRKDLFSKEELHRFSESRRYNRNLLHDLCNPMELEEVYSWLTANVLPPVQNYLK